jgi:hypothetical protein
MHTIHISAQMFGACTHKLMALPLLQTATVLCVCYSCTVRSSQSFFIDTEHYCSSSQIDTNTIYLCMNRIHNDTLIASGIVAWLRLPTHIHACVNSMRLCAYFIHDSVMSSQERYVTSTYQISAQSVAA